MSLPHDNLTSIHGIFAFLRDLNGKYQSRYEIEQLPNDETVMVDRYFDSSHRYYQSENDHLEITIHFNSLFLLTGYAIGNASPSHYNSYPTGWNIFGVDSNNIRHLLDSQTKQKFGDNSAICTTEIIKGYQVKTSFGYRKFIFQQTSNSLSHKYILLKGIDLYGTLCGIGQKCKFTFRTCVIHISNHRCLVVSSVYLLIMY